MSNCLTDWSISALAENNEEISKVLFELSSNRRASILLEVKKENLKMQQISKALDMTATETFRHLQRLTDAKLIEKNVDGTYTITTLGGLASGVLSNLNFMLKNTDYFLEHSTALLPYEFVNRLGELSNGRFYGDTMSMLNQARELVYEAEESLWVIGEEIDTSHVQPTNQKISMGLKFRFLMQQNLTLKLTPEVLLCPHCKKAMIQDVSTFKERHCRHCERKSIERIPLALLISEKEAILCLRRNKGEMDYAGFFGRDERFLKWCRDLFLHYWDRAAAWYPS